MNATAASGLARIAGVVLVLIIAAAAGMAVGNVLRERVDMAAAGPNIGGYVTRNSGGTVVAAPRPNIGGYVTDNPGGTIVRSRTAEATFSLQVIQQLNEIRANEAAAADASHDDTSDYGLRHPQLTPDPGLPGTGQRKGR